MQLQKNIAKNIIRLHVIANSDSDTDQALKLAIRDEIIGSLQAALKNTGSIEQAENVLLSQKDEIYSSAQKVLAANHHPAKVTVTLEPRYFPVKQYGDLTFPAGVYQALCVEIGKAEGRNWWCVAFPPLCLGAASETVDQALEAGHFTPDQGALVTGDGEGYVLKFKAMELLGELQHLLS